MAIAESVKAFFTATISTISNFFNSQILPVQNPPPPSSSTTDMQNPPPPPPPSSSTIDMQNPPPPSSSTVDSESQAVVPNVSEQNHSELQVVAAHIAPYQNRNHSELQVVAAPIAPDQNREQLMLEWQKAVMAFCFTSALEIAVLFAQTQSELSVSFHFLSFAILLIFLSLFIANFINHNTITQVLEMVAVMLVVTTIVFTITIPFPLSLKCVTWSLYGISLFVVFICRYRF